MSDSTADQFHGNFIRRFHVAHLQGEIVTFLLGSLAGESGVAGDILQLSADDVAADINSGLEITGQFPEQRSSFITLRTKCEAYEGFTRVSRMIAENGTTRAPLIRVSIRYFCLL